MGRPRAEIISEMVDSGLFSDDEIRSAAKGSTQSSQTHPEQGVLGAVGAAMGSRPELQPYAYQPGMDNAPAPQGYSGVVQSALGAAGQTLGAPIRMGQTLSQGPQATGEAIAETGGELGYPKLGVALGAIPAMAPYVLGAGQAIRGLSRPPLPQTGYLKDLSDKARNSASSRWFQATGGTLQNAKELGPEETLRLGRFAREGGYVTPLNSAESQARNIEKGLKESGAKIGELRSVGELYGDAPPAQKIVQIIKQDLGPKYKTGLRSGESKDLEKAIQEIMKLEPIDTLTPGEELAGFARNRVPLESRSFTATTPPKGSPTIKVENPAGPFGGKMKVVPNPDFVPPTSRTIGDTIHPYEKFRALQEDPNYIPEYDIRRPTTFNEVAKVATDINKYAKGQSKLLQPSGALTEAANTASRLNDEKLLKVLPSDKGAEYTKNLQKFGDLSKLDRINELKLAYEAGGSRNSIINNLVNRIYHKFGHQLSAQAMDMISNILGTKTRFSPNVSPELLAIYVNGRKKKE